MRKEEVIVPIYENIFSEVQYVKRTALYTIDGRKTEYEALAEVKDYVKPGTVIIPGSVRLTYNTRLNTKWQDWNMRHHPQCRLEHVEKEPPKYIEATRVMVDVFEGVHPKHVLTVLEFGKANRVVRAFAHKSNTYLTTSWC